MRRDRHARTGEWWDTAYTPKENSGKGKAKGKAKGKGKGKDGQQERSRRRSRSSSRPRSKSRGKSIDKDKDADKVKSKNRKRSKSRGRSSSRRRDKSADAKQSDDPDFQPSAAQRRKDKKAAKLEEKKKEREQRGAQERERAPMCTHCYYEATYATSTKCFRCKTPFAHAAAAKPAPAPPAAAPAVQSPALDAVKGTLKLLEASLAVKKEVKFAPASAKPPPPPPPAAATPAKPVAAAPVEGAAEATPVSMDTDDDTTGDITATKLADLRKKKAHFSTQVTAYADEPALLAVFRGRVDEMDTQIKVLLNARQLELAPHQLGLVLSQRQHELSLAQKSATDIEAKNTGELDAFDKRIEEVALQFKNQAAALETARVAADTAFKEERTALLEKGTNQIAEAQLAVKVASDAVTSVQSLHDSKCCAPADVNGQEKAEAATPPAVDAGAAHNAAQIQHLKAKEALINTQAAQNAMLMKEMAEMKEQMASLQPPSAPTALLPPVVLDTPEVPSDPAAQQACLALWQSLRLLAQQATPVPVAFADLARAHLPWADFLRLIPIKVAAAALDCPVGTGRGPQPHQEVPRRLLELLRTQLDSIVSQLSSEQKAVKEKTQLTAECNAWAATVIDQAKRISERKRPPAASAESLNDAQTTPLPEDKSVEVL